MLFDDSILGYTFFYIRKIFTRKWASKTQNLKKILENLQPQASELQFLKTLIFPRAL